jgi:hypothetical protein
MIQEKLGATVSPNATHTSAPAERQPNGKEQEIIKVKGEMSEEIQRLNSELDAMGIVLKGKEKPIRRAKRRSKLRVYLP